MSKTRKIIMPQENVSDDSYTVVEMLFKDGDKVEKNQNILVCEGSKAAFDIEADVDGYISYKKNLGDEVGVGEVIAEISSKILIGEKSKDSKQESLDINISNKAAALAKNHDIDLSIFEGKAMVSSKDIQKIIDIQHKLNSEDLFHDDDIAIIGSGGHAKQIYDSIKDQKSVVGLIVNVISEEPFDDLSILGTLENLKELRKRNLKKIIIGFGSIKNPQKRQSLSKKLESIGFELESVIHPSAIIETSAMIESGAQIFAGAIIGSRVKIASNAIINSGAIVSHDCSIHSNAHITPGAILAGCVEVGENTIIGMGSSIYLGVKIGPNLIIQNGTDISQDLIEN